jgi:hypothetical protein
LLIAQILAVSFVGFFAYKIQSQNYDLQKALYDFEPQVSGFVNGYIYVYENNHQAVANIEILINAPHSGNVALSVNRFYPQTDYLDPEKLGQNNIGLGDSVIDTTYPQAYRFRADVPLIAYIYPKQNLTNIVFFDAGRLEFQIFYHDVPKNTSQTVLFNGTVRFEFPQ